MSAAELGEAHSVRNRVFAAPADDPRARRPVDAATLVVSVVVVCLLGSLYRGRGDVDVRVLDLFAGQLPGWLSGVATIAFIVGGLYVVGLMVGILVLGQRSVGGRSRHAARCRARFCRGHRSRVSLRSGVPRCAPGDRRARRLPVVSRSCGSPLRSRRSESRGRIWRCRCAGSVTAWSLRCRLLRWC